MKYFIFLLLFMSVDLFAQYGDYNDYTQEDAEMYSAEEYTDGEVGQGDNEYELYQDQDDSGMGGNTQYIPAYKTLNTKRLRSEQLPELFTSHTVLENLNNTYWRLKFYNHEDVSLYDSLSLEFKGDVMRVLLLKKDPISLSMSEYRLLPHKSLKPNEGIYIHVTEDEEMLFVYIKLLQRNMLTAKVVTSYDEVLKLVNTSLAELPVFFIQ